MPTYISLINLTEQGAANISEAPQTLEEAKEVARSMGVEMKSWYLTLGRYDIVVVFEAPDDETAASFVIARSSVGHLRTETLRAFSEAEFAQIIAKATG